MDIEDFKIDRLKLEREFLAKLQELEEKYSVEVEDVDFVRSSAMMAKPHNTLVNLRIKFSVSR